MGWVWFVFREESCIFSKLQKKKSRKRREKIHYLQLEMNFFYITHSKSVLTIEPVIFLKTGKMCHKITIFFIPILVAAGTVISLSGAQDRNLWFVSDLLEDAHKFSF